LIAGISSDINAAALQLFIKLADLVVELPATAPTQNHRIPAPMRAVLADHAAGADTGAAQACADCGEMVLASV
jgi:hypothetical protein